MSAEKDLTAMLGELKENGRYPMHMPGHKRNPKLSEESFLPYEQDITEIEGFDNLHSMNGVIKNIAESAAALYRTKYAFPLVNGSTCGILAAVRALTKCGDRVIVARNCHRSVYHAIELCGLLPYFIYPKTDAATGVALSVEPRDVENAFLSVPDAVAVILTSPTYEGIISDIESIADIAHSRHARVILDAAHGAHCGLYSTELFPECGISFADVSITSLHKTMPSLTQTALALVNCDGVTEKLSQELSVFQTSSPSYILLSSIERCIGMILSDGKSMFEKWAKRLEKFEMESRRITGLSVFAPTDVFAFDRSKISILCDSGSDLAKHIRNCGIEPEMASLHHLLLMTSMCDTDVGFERVLESLKSADGLLNFTANGIACDIPRNRRAVEMYEAHGLEGKRSSLADAQGKISLDYIMAYPPGIPIVVPGEIISRETLGYIKRLKDGGINVNGDFITVFEA